MTAVKVWIHKRWALLTEERQCIVQREIVLYGQGMETRKTKLGFPDPSWGSFMLPCHPALLDFYP